MEVVESLVGIMESVCLGGQTVERVVNLRGVLYLEALHNRAVVPLMSEDGIEWCGQTS
jgi:hypothetical protein